MRRACQKVLCRFGERKSLQTDRVILVPGPPQEVEIVRHIYRSFVERGIREREIAEELNKKNTPTDLGRQWTRATVHQVLTNEKYVGNNVYNRISFKLKRQRVANAPDMWVRSNGVFEPLVDADAFERARAIIEERSRKFSDEDLLELLRKLLESQGALSGSSSMNAMTCPRAVSIAADSEAFFAPISLSGLLRIVTIVISKPIECSVACIPKWSLMSWTDCKELAATSSEVALTT